MIVYFSCDSLEKNVCINKFESIFCLVRFDFDFNFPFGALSLHVAAY